MKSVELITTSRYISLAQEKIAIQSLKQFNVEEITFNRIKKKFRKKWAGTPQERHDQFVKACRSESEIIWNCLGESGAIQLVDKIKFKNLPPKIIIGSSDFCILSNQLAQNNHILAINAPNISTRIKQNIFEHILKIINKEEITLQATPIKEYDQGQITGIIRGGNLISLTWILGSKFEVPMDNSILILDKLGKSPVSTYNNLVQMKNTKRFNPKAIVIQTIPNTKKKLIFQMLKELFPSTPILYNTTSNGKKIKAPFPIGRPCIINLIQNTISY